MRHVMLEHSCTCRALLLLGGEVLPGTGQQGRGGDLQGQPRAHTESDLHPLAASNTSLCSQHYHQVALAGAVVTANAETEANAHLLLVWWRLMAGWQVGASGWCLPCGRKAGSTCTRRACSRAGSTLCIRGLHPALLAHQGHPTHRASPPLQPSTKAMQLYEQSCAKGYSSNSAGPHQGYHAICKTLASWLRGSKDSR
jgi:hypothetical protein